MKRRLFMVVILGVMVLTGCGGKEKEMVMEAKESFRVLYDYEEDKIRPVLDNELTEEELAKKYLLTRLGLEEEDPVYKERGVLEEQGIFVESAIYDGGSIPNVTAMSDETAEVLNGNRKDRSLEKKEEEFNRLIKNRQDVLEKQYDTDNTGLRELEQEIKRQVIEHSQDGDQEEKEETEEVEYEYDEEWSD